MPTEGPLPAAESVYARALASLELGQAPDIESMCRAHPDLAADLRALHQNWKWLRSMVGQLGSSRGERTQPVQGSAIDPGISLDEDTADSDGDLSLEILKRLAGRSTFGRYRIRGEIARGGQGVVLRVWDDDVRRNLAMKMVLGSEEEQAGPSQIDSRSLGRFLEEAQITGQLDHPGIVPVHELGLDSEGYAYFTMKLVKGQDLRRVLDKVQSGEEGWTFTRALNVILKVCEAMSYAHAKGVIHRDLKPGNVMVGRFGEVYVMDWGLAKVLGREDTHELRLKLAATSTLQTERSAHPDGPETPLLTMDGTVVGTPAYMPPEQARGEIASVDKRSDVYSLGAILYHLLTCNMPYVPPDVRVSGHAVWRWVLEGPPRRVHELNPDIPMELEAICERAMSRDPEDRYADTLELAEDLRAYLEHRVVQAYRTGALVEFRKWVERNKGEAAAIAAAIVLLVAGLFTSSILYTAAEKKADQVFRLSAIQTLKDLEGQADALWPLELGPSYSEECEQWLAGARALMGERKDHSAELDRLRSRVTLEADQVSPSEATELRWWQDQLFSLVKSLDAFQDPETGLVEGLSSDHGLGVAQRIQLARRLAEETIESDEARGKWYAAIASIADREECPRYRGLEITPQFGLLPVGRDSETGLWEFAHLQSGAPARRESGRLAIGEGTGLVFVLLPPGEFMMGSVREGADEDEGPVHAVELSAFFISKYEMTQAQWMRVTGANPSYYDENNWRWTFTETTKEARARLALFLLHFEPLRTLSLVDPDLAVSVAESTLDLHPPYSLDHPVEQISWEDCQRVLPWMGLELPTEAQWEYAARAGSTDPWWTGEDPTLLVGTANLADAFANAVDPGWKCEKWSDGYLVHAPVDAESLAPNGFGLHGVHGNVWEWCLDGYARYRIERQVDPETALDQAQFRVRRGGSFMTTAARARSSHRGAPSPNMTDIDLGVRPARHVVK